MNGMTIFFLLDAWQGFVEHLMFSCERPSLNPSVVVLFVMFSGNLFHLLLFYRKRKICNCLYYIEFV